MYLRVVYLIGLLLSAAFLNAQLRVIKPVVTHPKRTTLAFGAGVTRSVVYLSRNFKQNNDATGLHLSAVYGGSKLLRGSAEFSSYGQINIEPTWLNIKAQTIEANMHFLARFKSKKAVFYPIMGISYNVFSGYFTGVNDYLHLSRIYPKNRRVTTRWLGFNAGVGFEFYIRPASVFMDYKMRLGITEGTNQLNIMDVCYTAGIRFNLRVPSFYSIFKGTRSRYLFDTKDNDW